MVAMAAAPNRAQAIDRPYDSDSGMLLTERPRITCQHSTARPHLRTSTPRRLSVSPPSAIVPNREQSSNPDTV